MHNVPHNFKDAITIFLAERSYLIQLLKGLINRLLPRDQPKFFQDSFLASEFEKMKKRRGQSYQPLQPIVEVPN